MSNKKSIIALPADTNDPEDFDATEEAVEKALAERRTKLGRKADEDKERVSDPRKSRS